MTVDDMTRILAEEYGIHSEAELDAALQKVGAIPISLFVDERKEQKNVTHRKDSCGSRMGSIISRNLDDDRSWNRGRAAI